MSREKGAQAEEAAARFLEDKGCVILDRNFRSKFGELDLVVRDGDTVAFVEVRSRSDASYGSARETVGPAKRRKIIKAAQYYIQRKVLDCPMRFDVIAIDGSSIEHIPNAFDADGFV